VGVIAGTFFIFIGLTIAIPGAGWFGVLWTLGAIAITAFNAWNLLSDRGVSLYDVDVDVREEKPPAPEAFDSKLRKLARLREDGLITDEEFQRKRAEILNEKW
jgi:UPF0716 family protein affecting phage T7 exclusion